jgi:hypothetical protein
MLPEGLGNIGNIELPRRVSSPCFIRRREGISLFSLKMAVVMLVVALCWMFYV